LLLSDEVFSSKIEIVQQQQHSQKQKHSQKLHQQQHFEQPSSFALVIFYHSCDKHRSEGDEQAMNFCTDALPQELHSLADN